MINLIHKVTHKSVIFERSDVGSVFMCYRRLFPKHTFVEFTAPNGTKCGTEMTNPNFEKFANEMISNKMWTTDLIHELIHKYG